MNNKLLVKINIMLRFKEKHIHSRFGKRQYYSNIYWMNTYISLLQSKICVSFFFYLETNHQVSMSGHSIIVHELNKTKHLVRKFAIYFHKKSTSTIKSFKCLGNIHVISLWFFLNIHLISWRRENKIHPSTKPPRRIRV